ncbi:Metal-dependent hydrolase, endonuclease/exonuclease/phosphatase family [Zhouia amylolytica]|uniref:Metal-dependent hydrolase, endonuclease/exonuclease/phosphatase family n=1 Tax=Zhouia amylolytica TaxID=376730 RepID=A0A1I6S694_9FLAO|nr:endonuclease/exonuclease/phosphatase family protein [Zhouia amylolytica]MCQ0111000.1 endonuclease/exonuclease/phosphatase family protein [Zhouia amylolytica]SFS72456.1 Metal-dependent hydrolase, endonuclease/exonuclease/phosphatase family [Zhouia amylolytica]
MFRINSFKSFRRKKLIGIGALITMLHVQFLGAQNNVIVDFETLKSNKHQSLNGVSGKGLLVKADEVPFQLPQSDQFDFDFKNDFSVMFWVKTEVSSSERAVLLSQKPFVTSDLESQKIPGWVFYMSDGTWAWNVGSGSRRITYERDNGSIMPLNDGAWHLLGMTYDASKGEIRLYYDGINRAIYNLSDQKGLKFENDYMLSIGQLIDRAESKKDRLDHIDQGAERLQKLVDVFLEVSVKNGGSSLSSDDLIDLVVDPEMLLQQKGVNGAGEEDLERIEGKRKELKKNPYTVYQVKDFMQVAPLKTLYYLKGKSVKIDKKEALRFVNKELFSSPNFAIDQISLSQMVFTPKEVVEEYTKFKELKKLNKSNKIETITAAVWNIHHGGVHNTLEEDGWDSRKRIVEMLKAKNADVIMMQETYSSGDFIAAELGYYFATTVDWDYLNQGTNISVLSRYPIDEISVPEKASFMNLCAKIALTDSQDIYVMSNWYGMSSFPIVFDFHKNRFETADEIPVLFGGDFNAIPNTDGGESIAAETLLKYGFTDAYRSLYPNVQTHPGYTFQDGRRIDQLYYLGKKLKNTNTQIISSWPEGFPSDHYMILSDFTIK